MEMTGENRLDASRSMVWAALNDPVVLKSCIPGCEELDKTSDTEFSAKVTIKIGPIRAKFSGNVMLCNIKAEESYTIRGEGQGGIAGFAKGGADVVLEEDPTGATILRYTVQASVGGKIAQLGARLIDSTAKKLADEFFARFAAVIAGEQELDRPDPGEQEGVLGTG